MFLFVILHKVNKEWKKANSTILILQGKPLRHDLGSNPPDSYPLLVRGFPNK